MRHVKLIFPMILTCLLVVLANVAIEKYTGFELFSFSVWVIFPIGACIMGFLAASGAAISAYFLNVKPDPLDAIAMIAVGLATFWLIYYVNYITLILPNGRYASNVVSFGSFVDFAVRSTALHIGRVPTGPGVPVGDFGYLLAFLQMLGFILGGAFVMVFITSMPECATCKMYLRKIKERSINGLTIDQATQMVEIFSACDFDAMQDVIAWKPVPYKFPDGEKWAMTTYRLFECKRCGTEAVTMAISVGDKRRMNDVRAAARRREIAAGSSLKAAFAPH